MNKNIIIKIKIINNYSVLNLLENIVNSKIILIIVNDKIHLIIIIDNNQTINLLLLKIYKGQVW